MAIPGESFHLWRVLDSSNQVYIYILNLYHKLIYICDNIVFNGTWKNLK